MINLTIKQKLVAGIIIAIIASTSLVGIVAQKKAFDTLDERLTTLELPTILKQIGGEVDKEVAMISASAEQMANNSFIIDAISDPTISPENQTILIKQLNQLKQQYQLNDASVANRNNAYYWNQDGFLRQLTQEQDAWFFGFTQSGPERMLNVFTEQNGEVKLFVNFQQLNGVSMAGFSKSLDDMVSLLNGFTIEKTGFVYLMDANGDIKIHKSNSIMGKQSISDVVGTEASTLLTKQEFNLSRIMKDGQEIFIASHYIPSMEWFIVAEVPVDEVFESLHASTQDILMWIVGIIAVFVTLAIWGAGSITNKIKELAHRFRELGEGEGDLTHRIEVKGNDEIAELSKGFNSFVEKIHSTVTDVVETGHLLHTTAENVALKATSTRDNSEMQRDQTLQVVTAINQMGSTINEIASNAASAAQSASKVEASTQDGRQTVIESRDAITQLEGDLVQVSHVVEQLAGTTQDIGSILDVIRGISDQTNLLALNAAIEAARAGEHGRGFAVVADEVRQLASRTSESTDEIQKMIDQLQTEAQNAVTAMEASHAVTARGVQSADTATDVLAGIALSITDISDMNTQVATATEEQSTVVYTINQNIEEINGINELTTATAQELADSSQQLNALSQRLDQLVGAFKV
ncbi:methyl-accepting chemotaxis protein [Aliivibrio finisterrensis]|uniref:methyl-accepting chemotaxis protein n=1 Tax=Aliivibrio finisterrensis TaxID=511998 RepID=UPI0010213C03|nr:methyl-accepting chemotaxis protein [Aliivibrio finisterrensis]RYU70632.1 methyl-accepting chemotaxis protein [Aliivibrio finisterrensis]RYU74494.1 methyl-accepting chemotaxis protein [Aliivibrio finisterrensis]RYU77100.1 methyl-accepting chemotaxis protein [Aliivibrio finisterrensis]